MNETKTLLVQKEDLNIIVPVLIHFVQRK